MTAKLPEEVDSRKLDSTGKTVFDGIYDAPDPRRYYGTMQALDYQIPSQALPFFEKVVELAAQARPEQDTHCVLDLGSSYGVNAALLKWDVSLEDLYAHYAEHHDVDRQALLAADQALLARATKRKGLEVVGFDVAENALDYASQAGLVDHVVRQNLEENDASSQQNAIMQRCDCVVSSGCIGYISETSLEKILAACAPRQPWMAHCILRAFDTAPFEQLFRDYGYQVSLAPQLLRQRRFASAEEQAQMLARLQQQGVDPEGYEADGWLYARMLMAVPEGQVQHA